MTESKIGNQIQKTKIEYCNQYYESSQSGYIKSKIFIGVIPNLDISTIVYTVIEIRKKWLFSRLWVESKIMCRNTEIPRQYKYTKKLGILLYSIFRICERFNTLNIVFHSGNIFDWFQQIVNELSVIEIMTMITELQPKKQDIKKPFIKFESSHIKTLKNNDNPFKKYDFALGLNTFIEVALKIKCNSENGDFYKEFWSPFLSAYCAYIRDIDKNYTVAHPTTYYLDGKYKKSDCEVTKGKGTSPNRKVNEVKLPYIGMVSSLPCNTNKVENTTSHDIDTFQSGILWFGNIPAILSSEGNSRILSFKDIHTDIILEPLSDLLVDISELDIK